MIDYEEHDDILKGLDEAKSVSKDMYQRVRDKNVFLYTEGGQWQDTVVKNMGERPRYTDDRCNPIVDSIAGEMEQNDFAIKVKPASGGTSKETAETIEGLLRNIQNISGASLIYSAVNRALIGAGFSCAEVVQDYIDSDTFDQDLFIKEIQEPQNKVWFDPMSILPDRSDAEWVVVQEDVSPDEYEDKFPDGKQQSLGSTIQYDVVAEKPESITIGRLLYKKPIMIELAKMSNGAVYRVDDEFESLIDELAQVGIAEVEKNSRRKRKTFKVCQRYFDNGGWLADSEETVFNRLPIIPFYGNFKIIDGVINFCGAIGASAMDMQYIHNMTVSRVVEEAVLTPRAKYWGTQEQRAGHEASISTLNTNSNPWQDYNHVDGTPPPYIQGGGQINPVLQQLSMDSANAISLSTGTYSPQLGDNVGLQSGIALDKQINKGDISNQKYYTAFEVGLRYLGLVIVGALPEVYDAERMQRIFHEDGTDEFVTLNEIVIIDQQTRQTKTLNDLSTGEYDVEISVGEKYSNRQEKTAEAFAQMAAADPAIMELGRDVWLKNQGGLGMDDVAERARAQMLNAGVIPFEQMTEEEQAAAQQAAQQPPQPDPMMLAAEAEMQKAQAEQMNAQNKMQESQTNAQIKMAELQLDREKLDLQRETLQLDIQKFIREKDDKYNVEAAKINQGQQKIDLETQKMINDMSIKLTELEMQVGQQLNAEVSANMLTFDPATGDFVQGGDNARR
jgi:hypothetical protein